MRFALLQCGDRGGRQARRGPLPRGLRRRPREHGALRPAELHGLRAGGDLVPAAGQGPERARRPTCSPPRRPTRGTSSTCGRTPRRPRSRGSRAYGAQDWEPVGHEGVVPRSSLNPHPALQRRRMPGSSRRASVSPASRSTARAGPGRTTCASWCVTAPTAAPSWPLCCGRPAARRSSAGILAPVRTYESTGRQAAEAAGFEAVGQVSVLVREVLASVRQPAMVPAV